MAHPQETRVALRAAYLGGLGLELAAVKVGVPVATARRWKQDAQDKGDDWDKFQSVSLMVAGGGMEQAMRRVSAALVLQMETTLEELAGDTELGAMDKARAMGMLTDSMTKAQSAMKRLMPETDQLAIETGAVKAFAELLIAKAPAQAGSVLQALDAWAAGQR
jgi:hypothetical protein